MNSRVFVRGMVLAGMVGAAAGACDFGDPSSPPLQQYSLSLVAEGLVSPVTLVAPPDNSGRLFVVDQIGRVRVIDANGQLLAEPFLDVSARMVGLSANFDERGLLGLAFHPAYAANRRFYVYYSAPLRPGAPANWNHTGHISEFQASVDPLRADPASERIILRVDQPQFNHNGGTLAFGPDGMLYISLGDGGAANDVGVGHVSGGNAQDPTNLLGSILRIDVDSDNPYGIPAGNPFVGQAGRDEIYAYGFRNPYRFSFDMLTGDLLVGDVGQNLWEEVNRVVAGGNYGWNRREGAHCFDPENPDESPPSCPTAGPAGEPLLDPVLEYPHANQPDGLGIAVIGGHVYRGFALPEMVGRYVFGDFSEGFQTPAGRVFAATRSQIGLWDFEELTFPDRPGSALGHFLKGFGVDRSGEIYVLTADALGPTGSGGRVYRLVRRTP